MSLSASASRKSSWRRSKASGAIGWLTLPHHTVFSVTALRTMNLSLAARPVNLPVRTTSGPSLAGSVPEVASPPACHLTRRWLVPRRGGGDGSSERMSQVIALVDDDRNILTSVSIALQTEGFVTRVYSDASLALKAISDNPP